MTYAILDFFRKIFQVIDIVICRLEATDRIHTATEKTYGEV